MILKIEPSFFQAIAIVCSIVLLGAGIALFLRFRRKHSQSNTKQRKTHNNIFPSREAINAFKELMEEFQLSMLAYYVRMYGFELLELGMRDSLLENYPVVRGTPILDLMKKEELVQAGYDVRQRLLIEYLNNHGQTVFDGKLSEIVSEFIRQNSMEEAKGVVEKCIST